MSTELNVRQLRERLRETQAAFAARFGVDQGTVSNWETGKTKPSGPAKKLMEALAGPDDRTGAAA